MKTEICSQRSAAPLDAMEKAGASIAERMQAAVAFFEAAEKQNPPLESDSSEPNAADEELTFADDSTASDPSENDASASERTSEHDASRSEPHASRSERTSEPNASPSEQESEQESEPALPAPPKFQFGPGNPLYEMALDFRAFRDKRSILDRLTDADRAAIINLLKDYSEDEVAELLAKHPPAGLNIRVSRPALNRFRHRYEKQRRARNRLAFQLECDRLVQGCGSNDQAFLFASERYLKMRLFAVTSDPNANLQTIDTLTDIITRLRKQSLAERKQSAKPIDADKDTCKSDGPSQEPAPPPLSRP